MTASADKVQFLLEGLLEETLPLVKKGVFSQQQLRQIMLERQKHQNKLYSATFKLSHFLKAIQFEYDLERKRQFKIKSQEGQNVNPLFKKQSKTDFSVVKRIIKLWDRTMHKFRYRAYLWKQYLCFCIAINSKKNFYKALTNALRFLPFQLQLWKIGVRYEVQIGKNMWKARKLFHKALKLVPAGQKNIQLTKELIKFQLQFVQTLQTRQNIIKGQIQEEDNNMKFIMGQNNEQNMEQQSEQQQQGAQLTHKQAGELLKLRQYHEILFIAVVDSIQRNYKSNIYFSGSLNVSAQQRCQQLCDLYTQFLNELNDNQQNELLSHILITTIKKVKNYRKQLNCIKLEQKYENEVQPSQIEQQNQFQQQNQQVLLQEASQHCLLVEQQKGLKQNIQILKQLSKEEKYANEIMEKYQEGNIFDDKFFIKAIKEFCLKPIQLAKFLEPIIQYFLVQAMTSLVKNDWLRVPLKSLKIILEKIGQNPNKKQLLSLYSAYLTKQINKINPKQYIEHFQLLKKIIEFNKDLNKIENNNKLFRSILVNCKDNIQFVQRAKCAFTQ